MEGGERELHSWNGISVRTTQNPKSAVMRGLNGSGAVHTVLPSVAFPGHERERASESERARERERGRGLLVGTEGDGVHEGASPFDLGHFPLDNRNPLAAHRANLQTVQGLPHSV